jgi:hypothetical protein
LVVTPTFLTLVAIFMVTVALAMIIATRSYLRTTSSIRMRRMMARIGLPAGIRTLGDPQTQAIMKDVFYRCRKCPAEALCERWLAGNVEGGNAFCPNARIFETFAASVVPTPSR